MNEKPTKKVAKEASKEQSKTPTKSTSEASFEDFKPYIMEMRGGFWKVIISFAIGAVVGIVYYKQILSAVMSFFKLENINVVLTSPYQFIDLSINSGFFVGVIFAMPSVLYYILKFSKPALKNSEYKLLLRMLPASILLFIIGFAFGVWVLQFVVDLFSQTSSNLSIGNIWDLSSFMGQVIIMGVSLAMLFQLPIVITSLIKLNVIKFSAIVAQRKPIYAAIVIFAALMPPTDFVALAILTIVPVALFEITLLINRFEN